MANKKTEKTESLKMVSNVQILPFKTGCADGTDKILAFANITLFGKFLVRGLRVRGGQNGFYVQYPQDPNGMDFSSVVTPLDREARETVEAEVIEAYQRAGV
jgi:DNA-binding cell septation regulator SpoVG